MFAKKTWCIWLGLMLWTSVAMADSWMPPTTRIFATKNGRYGLLVKPIRHKKGHLVAEGTLFTFEMNGKRKVLWKRVLVSIPVHVTLFEVGWRQVYVVTRDMWGSVGGRHAMVLYDTKGQPRRSFRLEDILTPKEISTHVLRSVSSRWWGRGLTLSLAPKRRQPTLKLSFSWKQGARKTVLINLRDGKLVPNTPRLRLDLLQPRKKKKLFPLKSLRPIRVVPAKPREPRGPRGE